MKTKKKATKVKPRNKRVVPQTKATPAVKQPKPAIKVAAGVRSLASRRTAEGKFTRVIFNQIGGKECGRFAAMTWKERDAFMAKPENAVVRGRYEAHMASVGGQVNRFNPGQVVATPGALAALEASGESLLTYLKRHLTGDWGDVDAEDTEENELSLKHDWRLLSAYTLKSGTKIWVITEPDRSSTCLLLPEEY